MANVKSLCVCERDLRLWCLSTGTGGAPSVAGSWRPCSPTLPVCPGPVTCSLAGSASHTKLRGFDEESRLRHLLDSLQGTHFPAGDIPQCVPFLSLAGLSLV